MCPNCNSDNITRTRHGSDVVYTCTDCYETWSEEQRARRPKRRPTRQEE